MENGSTNRLRSIYGYYRRYILLLFALFAVLICVFCVLIFQQSSQHKAYDNLILKERFIDFSKVIDSKFLALQKRIEELRHTTENELFESRGRGALKTKAFQAIHYNAEKNYYHIDSIPEKYKEYITSNLTGLGSPEGRSPFFYRVIHMALGLMDEFYIIRKNNPNIKYLYFFSPLDFVICHPWEASDKYRFKKELFSYSTYVNALPQNNPARNIFWTDIYEDNGEDNILMTTCSVPIYDGDRFTGVLGADFTVDFLEALLTNFEPGRSGEMVIIDKQNRIIASSGKRVTANKKLPMLAKTFSALTGDIVNELPVDTMIEYGEWQIIKTPIIGTPFKILYIFPQQGVIAFLLESLGINLLFVIILTLILIIALVVFTKNRIIKPSEQMVHYLLGLSKNNSVVSYNKVPVVWHAWFDTIQNIFTENETLSDNLKERNKELEDNYLTIKKEIRAKAKVQEQKNKLEEQLQQAEKIKLLGQLAGGIAHDFNNQLGIITGYIGLIQTKIDPEPELEEYIETIVAACDNATVMTRQLLAYARKGQYETRPVNICTLLNKLGNVVQRTFTKRIAVQVICNGDDLMIVGDENQLDNAFLNLAINARDAMPKGGTLTISCKSVVIDEHNHIRQAAELAPGYYYCICFTDSGTGIEEETLSHIFEPFYTTKSLRNGSGMGLAAVYGTVNNHNGAIDVRSIVGEGTTFEIFLPQATDEQLSGAVETKPEPIRRDKLHVMVVDDEERYRKMLKTMLNELNHEATVIGNQNESVDYYRKNWQSVDLVIMDMKMPDMSGYQLFAIFKKINPEIRVIVISGYSSQNELQEMTKHHYSTFLKKPFDAGMLKKAIETLFR
jgi:signal transduction histidine kinase